MGAELPGLAGRLGQQFPGEVDGQLVRRQVVRHVSPVALLVLHVRPVLAHPEHDTGIQVAERERVQLAGVQVAEFGDQLVQPGGVVVAEVELAQHLHPVGATAGDLVEELLHPGGEGVVDQVREVFLEQPGDGECQPGRDQRGPLLVHVVPGRDGADDRGVRRRSADVEFLELRHQRGFGVAGRRLGLVAGGGHLVGGELLSLGQSRESGLGIVGALATTLLDRLHVRLEEAVEGDGAPRRDEGARRTLGRRGVDLDTDALALGVLHLRGHGALPDQLVQPELIPLQSGLRRGAEHLAGRSDRLVRLLRVLHLAGVDPRLLGQEVRTEELPHLVAGGADRGAGQGHRVGPHVGDVPGLVQVLGHRHRPLCGEAQLAAGLLLQGGGAEGRVRAAAVRLGIDRGDLPLGPAQLAGQLLGGSLVEVDEVVSTLATQPTAVVEVPPLGDLAPVDLGESGRELGRLRIGTRVQGGVEVPVGGGAERDPFPFAIHHQAGGDRLHPSGGQSRLHLLPQHRGQSVAVEPVEDPSGLLGVDQVEVEVAGVLQRVLDRPRGDLVEDHPLDRDLRLQFLQQVPGDRLPLAVTIGGEQEFVGVRQGGLEGLDGRLLVGVHDVDRLELVIDVDAVPRPLLPLVLGRHLGRTSGQVPNVSSARLDDVAVAEEARDRLHLGRRLDDDEALSGSVR